MQDSNSSNIDSGAQAASAESSVATAAPTLSPQNSALVRQPKRKPMSLGLALFLSIGLVTSAMVGFSAFIQGVQALQRQILNSNPAPVQSPLIQPTAEPLDDSAIPDPVESSEPEVEPTPETNTEPIPETDADASDAAKSN